MNAERLKSRYAKELLSILAFALPLRCEAKRETIIATMAMVNGTFQFTKCQFAWRSRKEVALFIEIIKSDVPAALFWGVL